jgi:uncharacterized MAPEG superfamily protein
MWAVLLGVLLILVAATSSHAAMRQRVDAHTRAVAATVAVHGAHVDRAHARR